MQLITALSSLTSISFLTTGADAKIINHNHSAADNYQHSPHTVVFYGSNESKDNSWCDTANAERITDDLSDHIKQLVELALTGDTDALFSKYPALKKLGDLQAELLVSKMNKAHEEGVEGIQSLSADANTDSVLRAYITNCTSSLLSSPASPLTYESLRSLRADLVDVHVPDREEGESMLAICSDISSCTLTASTLVDRERHEAMSVASVDSLEKNKELYAPTQDAGLSDPHYHLQWYLGSPPEQLYGAGVVRAWRTMLNMTEGDSFSGVTKEEFGESFPVVVVDMGCGYHDDMLYDASDPLCKSEKLNGAAVMGAAEAESHQGIKIEEEHPQVSGVAPQGWFSSDYCSTEHLPNEGHENMTESYFKDSSLHGTSTNSLIGAGWNDQAGIAGVCPFCTVKCIKISMDVETETQVNMAGIFRSLEFLTTFSEQYPISNHSYGGFFIDSIEVEAHKRLSQKGHLVVTAAGNYGCDIDPLAEIYGAFTPEGISPSPIGVNSGESQCMNPVEPSAFATMPMMPASVQLPTKIDVGALDMNGQVPSFSNYGVKSVEIFAPGMNILSLKAKEEEDDTSDGVVVQHGTSFSSPIVAGSLALLSRHMDNKCNKYSAESLIELLMSSGQSLPQLADKASSGATLDIGTAVASIVDKC